MQRKAPTPTDTKKLVVRKTALKNLTVRTDAKPAAQWTLCPVCGSY